MRTTPVTVDDFRKSVLAVPSLARDNNLSVCRSNNRKIVTYLERGGVSMLLYGGNANFYNISLSEYENTLQTLAELVSADTVLIPSVGPSYGMMMDQAAVLKNTSFPTVMVLPTTVVATQDGVMTGLRRFVERVSRPAVLYLKDEGYLTARRAATLVEEGLVSFIKYAIVRDDPAEDNYLSELVELVGGDLICSGLGEQPAAVHMNTFGCVGFTSGCVCINPTLSQRLLHDIQRPDDVSIQKIQSQFRPLEDLRNQINPIRVLHEAVTAAGIAETGPPLPLMSALDPASGRAVAAAAQRLKAL